MTKILHFIVAAAATQLLFVSSAHSQGSQQKMLMATCNEGQGCKCALTNVTLDEAAVLFGVPKPSGSVEDWTIYRNGDGFSFERRSIDTLHKANGGSGRCEVDLNLETNDGGIVPRDGTWTASVTDAVFQGCNPMLENMLRSSGVLNRRGASRHIQWGGKFDPTQTEAFNEMNQFVEWRQSGLNSFSGELFEISSCTARSGSSCSKVGAYLSMVAKSETEIVTTTQLNIEALLGDTGGLEQMAELGFADCKIEMQGNLRLTD